MSYKNKQIIEYETFDYYSIDPIDINDLYNKDKKRRPAVISPYHRPSLFVICFLRYSVFCFTLLLFLLS